MAGRTLAERVDRLEDIQTQQALASQSHQSTIDLVVIPMVERQRLRDEEQQDRDREFAAAKASLKTLKWIGGAIVTILTLAFAAVEVFFR